MRGLFLFELTALSIPLLTLILLTTPITAAAWILFLSMILLYALIGWLTPLLLPPRPWLVFFALLAHIILTLGVTFIILLTLTMLRHDFSLLAIIPLTLASIFIIPAYLIGFFIRTLRRNV